MSNQPFEHYVKGQTVHELIEDLTGLLNMNPHVRHLPVVFELPIQHNDSTPHFHSVVFVEIKTLSTTHHPRIFTTYGQWNETSIPVVAVSLSNFKADDTRKGDDTHDIDNDVNP